MRIADYANATALAGTSATKSARAVGPDLLRALAVLMVMLWHLPKAARVGVLPDVWPWGWLGVDVFFVLSGYLIGGQLMAKMAQGRRIDLADFYLRRAFRILPAFLVILALYRLVPTMQEGKAMLPAWRFLTFSMNWGLDGKATGTFSSAWSLCVEEHFYLLAPLVLLALRGRARWIGAALAGLILVGGMALRAELYLAAPDAPWNIYLARLYYPTWVRLDGLLLGVLLAAARTFHPKAVARWLPAWAALTTGLLALAGALMVIKDKGVVLDLAGATFGYPLFSLAVALLLCAAIDAEPWLSKIPLPGVATLAALSYSLYLVHKPVYALDKVWLGAEALAGWPALALYGCTVLTAALALHHGVERPFLALRDRVLTKRR
ncbi:acyltransferase [Caulobacter sp.]|uniref:acyltransferase family protein n=1 Tax=Caulobacter sp. TaxID=78 RepID=UPI002B458D3F|nr:acyltransferase [Caulobacter sp.]HJV41932.1 acyltransferase [Caulobacter sp.]